MTPQAMLSNAARDISVAISSLTNGCAAGSFTLSQDARGNLRVSFRAVVFVPAQERYDQER